LRSKLISAILSVAVMVSLMVVPAVPTALAASPDWAYEIQPDITQVGFNEDFNVTVRAECYAENADTWNIMVDFDPTYLEVISITRPATLPNPPDNSAPDGYPGEPTLNNTAGWVYDGYGTPPAKATVSVSFNAWTIHFKSKSVTTDGTPLNFITVDPYYSTMAILAGSDYVNWTEVVNGTVQIGSPTLTVNVNPAGKGTVNQAPLPPYAWNQVVNLEAVDSTPGWGFVDWTGDVADPDDPTTTITMSTDKTVTANFAELPPLLDVDPLALDFSARYGDNTDSKTVEISNDGGGTLCWAVGEPPTWTTGDNWVMYNGYVPFPGYNPLLPGSWNNTLVLTVTNDADPDVYAAYVDFLPWPYGGPAVPGAQRTIEGGIPAVLWNATVLVDKYTLDYVQQLAVMTVWLGPNGTNVFATVTWDYDGCHGWPYYVGKSWTYNVTQVVSLTPGGPPILPPPYTTACSAIVTDLNPTLGYHIVHSTLGTPFMQTWWSPTARNFAQQADGGTFDYPPLDVRSLLSFSVAAPPPAVPPAWISFDKTSGSLGIGESELLNVTASTTGLAVGSYSGSFDISAAGSIQVKTVDVALEVLPATTIDVIRNLPADAMMLDAETIGDVFDVYVNFTAPIDDFNSIGLTDLAPAGWDVQTDITWCSPVATWTMSPGNKAEYAWSGPYTTGQVFSAKYRVTIPATAKNGLNDWPNNDGTKAWCEYWFGAAGPYTSNVTGEWQKIVTIPGPVVGETRDVNAALLTTTLVVLSEQPPEALDEPEDSDSSTAPDALYEVWADDTGQYWMEASKYCYFDLDTNTMPTPRNPLYALYIDFGTTAKLYAGSALDFEGDYGLVPKACTMSYAMKSVNHWLFVPVDGSLVSHPEWQLSVWKAMESVHSWQFPAGCNM